MNKLWLGLSGVLVARTSWINGRVDGPHQMRKEMK